MPPDSSRKSQDAFQRLLFQLSNAASQGIASGTSSADVPQSFCRSAREFFETSGVYYWKLVGKDQLVGVGADGWKADNFAGRGMSVAASSSVGDALRSRQTLFVNRMEPERSEMGREFDAKSSMVAPVMVSGEATGVAVFVSNTDPDFFNEERATQATILVGQLGSLLEASRLAEVSREENRHAGILAEVAQSFSLGSDVATVVESLSDRLRSLLRAPLVCVMTREGDEFQLRSVAAEAAALAIATKSAYEQRGNAFMADAAGRAMTAGSLIQVAIGASPHRLAARANQGFLPEGDAIAAPFRTSQSQGAILVYPRSDSPFIEEERSLISAITGFGAVAIANAELFATAQGQAQELQQVLNIASELGSIRQLDEFMKRFVLRAAGFLGFDRAFLGLLENGSFHVRWAADHGNAGLVELMFHEGVTTRALRNKEVFWADDARQIAGANLEFIAKFQVRQVLAVPLLGMDGEVIGGLGVFDKADESGITQQDISRAQALASQVALALEVTRSLHASEQHRKRAELLMQLALELNSSLRLTDFAKGFLDRAMEIINAQAGALVVKQDSGAESGARTGLGPQILAFRGTPGQELDRVLLRKFDDAIALALSLHPEPIVCSTAIELLGTDLVGILGWTDCCLVRLQGANGDLVGVLCLASRGRALEIEEQQLLQAIAGHASVALENARLFSRMDQANRHWVEIFDAISDFIVTHDNSDNVLRVNRSLADFIGVSPNELLGVHMWALLSMGSDVPIRACPFCRMASLATDEYLHPVLDRTYLVSTSHVHGAQGEGLQIIHVLKDITDRREAERRYRELFDNIQEGLFFCTPEGRFIEVNDALVRMLGYPSREGLLQADIRNQIYFSADRHSDLVLRMQEHSVIRNREETLRRADGSSAHVLINAFAVRDAQGRVLQYRGLMLDISGLKTFQSELQRERDFSANILNNTQSLILVADSSGLVSYANRRWYELGYEQNRLMGRPLEELVHPSRREVLNEAFGATLGGKQVDNLDLQIVRGEGRVGHFSVNLSPMRDEQGSVTSIVVVMTDITDAAILQSKLIHAEKMAAVGQLVSGVAHEVNNPLTAILGFADLLMENPEVPESARKDLRVILQEAQRTKQIVQNLLSFARQMPPQRKPVQVNAVLRRTVQLRAYDFHSRGVDIVERLEHELPHVLGDAHQLQQVFLNILNNAYDSMRDIGRPARIELTTSTLGNSVEVSFRDNGQGISNPERIFDPFFTTKEVGKGTGLGLSICYGIVREHGGEILCHNNPDADGATFVVRFPIALEPASVGAAAGVTQP